MGQSDPHENFKLEGIDPAAIRTDDFYLSMIEGGFMKNWISLKTFSNRQAAQAMKVYLQHHGVVSEVHQDENGQSKLCVQLSQTEKAQKLIHS